MVSTGATSSSVDEALEGHRARWEAHMSVAIKTSRGQQLSVRIGSRTRIWVAIEKDAAGRSLKHQKWEVVLYEMTIFVCTVVTAAWIVWGVR